MSARKILFIEPRNSKLGAQIRNQRVYENLPSPKLSVKIVCNIDQKMLVKHFVSKRGMLSLVRALGDKFPLDAKHTFGRALLEILKSYNKGLERRIMKINPSLVVAEGVLTGFTCLHIAKKLSIPIIVDNHSWMSWEIGEKYPLIGKIMRALLESIEEYVFSESEYISVATPGLKENIKLKYQISESKIIVASNGGDIVGLQAKYKKPMNIVYAGALARQEGIIYYPLLLEKMTSQTYARQLNFYLIGDGDQKKKLLYMIRKRKLKINYLGLLTRDETLAKLSEMSVGLIFAYGSDIFPIKAFDYMSVGLPIVAFDVGLLGKLIKTENVGFAVEPFNIDHYLESILSLTEEVVWKEKSENAKRVIAEKYNWKKTLEPLARICSSFLK